MASKFCNNKRKEKRPTKFPEKRRIYTNLTSSDEEVNETVYEKNYKKEIKNKKNIKKCDCFNKPLDNIIPNCNCNPIDNDNNKRCYCDSPKPQKNSKNAKKFVIEQISEGDGNQVNFCCSTKFDESDEYYESDECFSDSSSTENTCPDMYRRFLGPTLDESILVFLNYFAKILCQIESFCESHRICCDSSMHRRRRKCDKKAILDVEVTVSSSGNI